MLAGLFALVLAAATQSEGCASLSTFSQMDKTTGWRDDGGALAIADAGASVYDSAATTPSFAVPPASSVIEFAHTLDLSWASTAAVLEISIDGAPWRDIVAAGGAFAAGGYDRISYRGNPLGERAAWGGQGATFHTRVVLPARSESYLARLRFRVGSGGTGDARGGWRIGPIACDW